jgi:hypothetical protein
MNFRLTTFGESFNKKEDIRERRARF